MTGHGPINGPTIWSPPSTKWLNALSGESGVWSPCVQSFPNLRPWKLSPYSSSRKPSISGANVRRRYIPPAVGERHRRCLCRIRHRRFPPSPRCRPHQISRSLSKDSIFSCSICISLYLCMKDSDVDLLFDWQLTMAMWQAFHLTRTLDTPFSPSHEPRFLSFLLFRFFPFLY